jgi:hypothetical protein
MVQPEGGREDHRVPDHYNLDAFLAVGYRVCLMRGTEFRRWATADWKPNGLPMQNT